MVEYYNGKYGSVERMEKRNPGVFGDLFNLMLDPTNIIDNIYLGNGYNASNYICLKKLKIGLIVNITCEIPNYYETEFEYMNIKILDHNGCKIGKFFDDFYDKLIAWQTKNKEKPLDQRKNILIHCFMGSSRSATLSCAYLIKKYGKSVQESLDFVREKRPVVNVNNTFIGDLRDWENELRNVNSVNSQNNANDGGEPEMTLLEQHNNDLI
jgi:atypical dual specificity phosphatase